MIGRRTKLYLFSLIAVTILTLLSGAYLQHDIRDAYETRLRTQLQEKASLSAAALRALEDHSTSELGKVEQAVQIDAWVDSFGKAADSRVTVIAPDGKLLGDSDLRGHALLEAESHADRPEVVQARREGYGTAKRFSTTVRKNMLYVAVSGGPSDSVVRVSMPTQVVDDVVTRLRIILLAAAGIGLLLASAVGGLSSHFAAKTLRALVESARSIGEKGHGRVEYSSGDDLGVLAGSLNHLAEELENNVRRLGEERDRLETILRGTSEGVLALDADKRIRLVNAAATALLQLPDSVEGKPLYDVSREPDLLTLAESGFERTESAEIKLDEPPRTLLGRADPLQATGGTVLVLHDVTEMRRLEAVRRDFVTNVSHELRTPVAIIRANSETLLDGALEIPKARQSFVEAIGRNSERLERLISDLLDLARVESGNQELHTRELTLSTVVERVVSLLKRKADTKDIELKTQFDPELKVIADEKALDQILVNLVDNAVKYTEAGGCVTIVATRIDQEVQLAVEDNGCGIPLAARSRIFERFYRVDPGRARDVGGTGLGLSIVKHLAQIMGGQVGVEGRVPQGSRFWVKLPTH